MHATQLIEFPPPRNVPVQGSGTPNADTAGRSSASFSHVQISPFLLVAVYWRDTTKSVSSVTYNGVALTGLTQAVTTTGSTGKGAQLFYLQNPAPGSNTLVVTWSGSVPASAVLAANIFNVNPVKPVDAQGGNNGNSSAPSLGLTGARPNALMVASIVGAYPMWPGVPGSGDTETIDARTGTTISDDIWYWQGFTAAGAPGAMAISATASVSDTWAVSGVVLNGAP